MHGPLKPTRRHGGQLLSFTIGLLAAGAASANPQGAQVVHGTASFAQPNPRTLEITNSPSAIINWQGFDIGVGETTRFVQQNAASAVLNRVVSGNSSEILGNLVSNGRVFLINPAGILIGRDGVVDTAGLVLSTLGMSNEDFLAGRLHFEGEAGAAGITNHGYIKSGPGGEVILVAPSIVNAPDGNGAKSGLIETPEGELILAAGSSITIASLDDPDISFEVEAPAGEVLNLGKLLAERGSVGVFAGSIRNGGTISADSVGIDAAGRVVLRASSRVVLDADGVVSAAGRSGGDGGEIDIEAANAAGGGRLYQLGMVDASGNDGGAVRLDGDRVLSAATATARGAIDGGSVTVTAREEIIATAASRLDASGTSGAGGRIAVDGGKGTMSSGQATATGMTGGEVEVLGDEITLAAAQVDASGETGGGKVRVGGGFQGGEGLRAATTVTINEATALRANGGTVGDGGSVVVWSDGETRFAGSIAARGGSAAGDGGSVEVSGKLALGFDGDVDVTAAHGEAGTLLLDPKNLIFTDEDLSGVPIAVLDPHPGANNNFGQSVQFFDANGFETFGSTNSVTLVVRDFEDDFGAADAGAVYVYRLADGALLSTLTGSNAGDQVGNLSLQSVGGAYLLRSSLWNGARGAITRFDTVNGTSGIVDSGTSLVGANAGDNIGSGGLQSLGGTFIAVRSPAFDGTRGALTVRSLTTMSGTVGAGNSLVGANIGDQVSNVALTNLFNGNYVQRSTHGTLGAMTFINPSNAETGVVGAGNSLVGDNPGDNVGSSGIAFLGSNLYAIRSPQWQSSTGALTYGSTLTGVKGTIVAGNSLMGGTSGDSVGASSPFAVGFNRYVLTSGMNGFGAVTVIDAGAPLKGTVSAANSLIGASNTDFVGSGGVNFVSGSIYAVMSPSWDATAIETNAGAVTFLDVSTGNIAGTANNFAGVVGASNSLVGSLQGDAVGSNGVVSVFSGNFAVLSPNWQTLPGVNVGAITWLSPGNALLGAVSNSNSLVGVADGDNIGGGVTDSLMGFSTSGIYSLFNGNAILKAPSFNNSAGAITFIDGSLALPVGEINDTNSLVGDDPGDGIGSDGIYRTGTYYIVVSPDFGTSVQVGAVTVGDAASGTTGIVSSANSLVGSNFGDAIGNGGLLFLNSGNALVFSPNHSSNAGALTYLDLNNGNLLGDTDFAGIVGAGNSLLGSSPGDNLGSGGIEEHSGYAFVITPDFTDGSNVGAGAVTAIDIDSGLAGFIGTGNSLIGSNAGDAIGSGGFEELDNGNLLLLSPDFNGTAGAITFFDMANGNVFGDTDFIGFVDSSSSLVGGTAGDLIGSEDIEEFSVGSNTYYAVFSPLFDNTGAGFTNSGAITFADADTGVAGVVSSANSLVGAAGDDDAIGAGAEYETLSNGNIVLLNEDWNSQAGAVTFVDLVNGTGLTGEIDSSNSVVGSQAGDRVGSDGIEQLSGYGKFAILSPFWANGAATNAGAVTWGDNASGVAGVVSAGNSLVGSNTGDNVGDCCDFEHVIDDLWVLMSPDWDGGRSALTFFDATNTLPVGAIDGSNSLVGDTSGDALGSGGVFGIFLGGGNKVMIESPDWDNGAAVDAGAITVFDVGSPLTGSLDSSNSLVGDNTGDRIGDGDIEGLGNDNRLLVNLSWNGNRGAVTFWDPDDALTGVVGAGNSLVGANAGDLIGSAGVFEFGGKYVVASPFWNGGMGAITFGSVTTGISGAVGAGNSLVGGTAGDSIGSGLQVSAFTNRLFSVSETWNGNRGAVTFLDPANPPVGLITASNSLIGSNAGDRVGDNFQNLFTTGNRGLMVFRTNFWNGNAGAVTIIDTTNPLVGEVSASNSLVGRAGDQVGSSGVNELSNGGLVVRSPLWSDGTAQNFGAVTVMVPGSGGRVTPTRGFVSSSNSLVGSNLNDQVGSGSFNTLSTGNIIVRSPAWNGNAGALTFVNISTGRTGVVSGNNSLVGALPNDFLGSGGITFLGSDRYLVRSPLASVNGIAGAGRIDLVDGATTRNISGDIGFDTAAGGDLFVSIKSVVNFLNTGATLKLQATNDITIPAGSGFVAEFGALFLEAGRSINVQGDLIVRNGTLSLLANAPVTSGRDPGEGSITLMGGESPILVMASFLSVDAQNIILEAGTRPGASVALVGLESAVIHAHGSGLLSLSAGTASGSSLPGVNAQDVFLNYLNAPSSFTTPAAFVLGIGALSVEAETISLSGGGSDGAFAALVSFGEFKVSAIDLEMLPGSGVNADAVLLGLGGVAEVAYTNCTGCVDLLSDPFLDGGSQSGLYISGIFQQPATDAILAMLGRDSDSSVDGEEDDDDDEEEDEMQCN